VQAFTVIEASNGSTDKMCIAFVSVTTRYL
jgi:hypothetical protein